MLGPSTLSQMAIDPGGGAYALLSSWAHGHVVAMPESESPRHRLAGPVAMASCRAPAVAVIARAGCECSVIGSVGNLSQPEMATASPMIEAIRRSIAPPR